MPHEAPSALQILTADYLATLDDQDEYTPVLTAATTPPTLGSGSQVSGWWHRTGHLITFGFVIVFGTSGTNAGSGIYFVSLPFPADTSKLIAGGTSQGLGSIVGEASCRDNSALTNSRGAQMQLASDMTVFFPRAHGDTTAWSDSVPFAWAASDALTGQGRYLADPDGLP